MATSKLCKKFCKKCHNNAGNKEDRIFNSWGKDDGSLWKKGKVRCYIRIWEPVKIISQPPENCPFYLEHVLETQQGVK